MSNFCGGFLTNTIEQSIVTNLVFTAGAAAYLLMKKTHPLTYFKLAYPITALCLCAASAVLLLNVSTVLLALVSVKFKLYVQSVTTPAGQFCAPASALAVAAVKFDLFKLTQASLAVIAIISFTLFSFIIMIAFELN